MTREPEHRPPAPEPSDAGDAPHDVLAAEEFPGPSREAAIHPPSAALPPEPDPSGEPHDVLAAEEFAMPAPKPGHELAPGGAGEPAAPGRGAAATAGWAAGLLALGAGALVALRRRRARGAAGVARIKRRLGRS